VSHRKYAVHQCLLSPISCPSTVREIVSAIGSNRPITDIQLQLLNRSKSDQNTMGFTKGLPKGEKAVAKTGKKAA
jgi:hypothetical protein